MVSLLSRDLSELSTDLPASFKKACTASSSNDCWLCDELPSWNSTLGYYHLRLKEEECGKLCLHSLPYDFAYDYYDMELLDYTILFLAYLPQEHKCIRKIRLHQKPKRRQAPMRPTLYPMDWRPAQPECNVQYIEISRIDSLDWEALVCGLGHTKALKGLLIEDTFIDDCFVSKLDPLLAANSGCLQKLAISASATESAGVSDRLIGAVSNCTHLTELSLDADLTTTGIKDLGRMLLSCKSIQKLSLRDRFEDERTRALLGALSCCVRTNASLTELHYESLNLDIIELLETLQFTCTLKHIVLSGCKDSQKTFGREHGVALGNALAANSGLRSLTICHCAVSELAAEDISTGLASNCTLERFDLSQCGMDFSVASTLCLALNTNSTLNMVVLDPNGGYISERIMFSQQLGAANWRRCVGMCWNEIMPHFLDALEQPSLCPMECRIQSNHLTVQSFIQVCSALASSTVESLSVTFVEATIGLAVTMREAIQKNRSIVKLNLQEDSVSSETCATVTSALSENKTVTKFSLRVHSMNVGMAILLSEILFTNHTLEELQINCIYMKPYCLNFFPEELEENCTLTHFSIFDERTSSFWSSRTISEFVDRNLSEWNCAVQFVLETCISRRRAEAFESLQGKPLFLQRVAAASGKSQAEVAIMVESAKRFIRSNYLFITGVVCQDICCYPSSRETQIDVLNSDCWFAITRYLRVSDVVRDRV